MDLAPTQELTELPPMTVLAYTTIRSLYYQELAVAYAVHSRVEYHAQFHSVSRRHLQFKFECSSSRTR